MPYISVSTFVQTDVDVDINLDTIIQKLDDYGKSYLLEKLINYENMVCCIEPETMVYLTEQALLETQNTPLPPYLRELLKLTTGRDFGIPAPIK